MTINDLDNMMMEVGAYGRAVLEAYVNAMMDVTNDLMRNDHELIVSHKERDVYIACEPYCTEHGIRLDELIKTLDNEAERRTYIKRRLEKGAA